MLIPNLLRNIPSPPSQFFVRGGNLDELLEMPRVSVVGSRKVTNYGRDVTTKIVGELAGQGIVIVSGLAFGVDALAHQAALDAGGLTIAVLPGSVNDIAPKSNYRLAMKILESGGLLVSEHPPGTAIHPPNFVARNRLISGLSDAVLITEAAEKSGSLHTARFALEQGKDVLAVPGNITSAMSIGTNNLIKRGATPVTCATDILNVLGIEPTRQIIKTSNDPLQQKLIDMINSGLTDADEIQQKSELEIGLFNQTLIMMEITGLIRPLGANHWTLN